MRVNAYWGCGDIEGVLTCVVSFLFYFIIVDFPEEAKFLTDEERVFVKARLQEDVGESAREEKITPKDVLNVFKDCEFCFERLGDGLERTNVLWHRQNLPRWFHVLRSRRSRLRLRLLRPDHPPAIWQ